MATRFGFMSTHLPTHCGLATFNAALTGQLVGAGSRGYVVRVLTGRDGPVDHRAVRHTWATGVSGGWRGAAAALGGFDVAIVQHEYGIYPGPDGREVVPMLEALRVPSIVVLHTVLSAPSAGQREVLEQVVAAAGAVVVMTRAAHDRLLAGYAVDPSKVHLIPHGTAGPAAAAAGRLGGTAGLPGGTAGRRRGGAGGAGSARPQLLTWGLLGPGKGIEWALRAMAELRDLRPAPTYTVVGQTHPRVRELDGEAYRDGLHRLGERLGVADAVRYDPVYRDEAALRQLVASADVVVLPYDSREQVTSGVLVEAVAAGVPVVATAFPHAVELLDGGPGLLVPHRDPAALAGAIRRILTEPGLAANLAGRGREVAASMRWAAVAARYQAVAHQLLSPRLPARAATGG